MAKSHVKTVITIVVVIFITIGLIWLETYKRQREQFKLAENYYSEKDYPNAIQRYDSTIHMYTPWSSRVKISAEKLWDIGKMYENQKEYERALDAYRSLRSSFYAVRWLVQPYQEWIDRCDTAITKVTSAMELAEKQDEANLVNDQQNP